MTAVVAVVVVVVAAAAGGSPRWMVMSWGSIARCETRYLLME